MTLTTGTARALPTPEQVESLLIKPVLAASVALNPLCSRVLRPTPLRPAARRHRRPQWVAEGAEIPCPILSPPRLTWSPRRWPACPWSPPSWPRTPARRPQPRSGGAWPATLPGRSTQLSSVMEPPRPGTEQPDGLAALAVGAGGVQDIAAGTAPTNLDAFAQAQMLMTAPLR